MARTGTAGPGPGGHGTRAHGAGRRGTLATGPDEHGTGTAGLDQPGTARPGTAGPGTNRGGTDRRPGRAAMNIPRSTSAIVAAAVAGGALVLAIAALRQPVPWHLSQSQWIVAGAMGALALGSWVWPVVVYRSGESEAVNLDECFFVVLALLVPPLLTLGTLALATTVAQAVRHRPLVKSAF